MRLRSLCCFISTSVVAAVLSAGSDARHARVQEIQAQIKPDGSMTSLSEERRAGTKMERQLEVGADGDVTERVDVSGRAHAFHKQANTTGGGNAESEEGDIRPTITGYDEEGCDGKQLGAMTVPLGADFSGDHCTAIKHVETGAEAGRIKFNCEDDGAAMLCIYKDVNDTRCELSEPFCITIARENTKNVAGGSCIPVTGGGFDKETFWTFSDFREDTPWPECLIPPLSMLDMQIYGVAGIFCGLLVNMCIWECCVKKKTPKHHTDPNADMLLAWSHGQDPGGEHHGGEHHGEEHYGGEHHGEGGFGDKGKGKGEFHGDAESFHGGKPSGKKGFKGGGEAFGGKGKGKGFGGSPF